MDERWMTTSEICDLLGITPSALRLYEKHNQAGRYQVNQENGYRSFPFESIAQLFDFRRMLSFGLSLKETSRETETVTAGALQSLLNSCHDRARDQAERLTLLAELSKSLAVQVANIPQALNRFHHATSPAGWLLDLSKPQSAADKKAFAKEARTWADAMPFVSFSPIIRREDASGEGVPSPCLFVDDKYAHLIEQHPSSFVKRQAAKKCVTTVAEIWYTDQVSRESLSNADKYTYVTERSFQYLEEHNLELAGDIFTRLIATGLVNPEDPSFLHDYYELWLPVS